MKRYPLARRLRRNIPSYLVWIVILVVAYFPLFWLVTGSLKVLGQQMAIPPVWLPSPATLDNWVRFFKDPLSSGAIVNSLIVTVVSVFLAFLLGIPASYSLARFKVGSGFILIIIMLVRMIPPNAFMVPLYIIAVQLKLHDTKFLLTLVYLLFILPVTIWFLLGFISAIPMELEENAKMEGCSQFRIIWHIILPLIGPGLAAVSVLIMTMTWNEFPLALVLTSRNSRTLPVVVNLFVSARSIEWGPMCAAGIFSAFPIVALGIAVQKFLVRGLLAGAVKE
jgi:multiple sugar transport system permease protein